jgi:hypothetical protein
MSGNVNYVPEPGTSVLILSSRNALLEEDLVPSTAFEV